MPDLDTPPPARHRHARPSLGRAAALSMAIALTGIVTGAPDGGPTVASATDWPASMALYHDYAEMVAEIHVMEAAHPDIVQLFSIGKSHQGRELWAAKVSDNVAVDEDEPEVLFDALHHAREHLTLEQAIYLFHLLVDNYGTDTEITNLVNGREIWIIFALNPDGAEYDLTGNPFWAWRKNRQPNSGSTAVGTDLNRNYEYRWGCCGGSSGTKSAWNYRGPAPFSAPETRAMRDFVNSRVVNGRQQIRVHITLHTNGQLILWPYGYTKTDVPLDMTRADHSAFVALAKGMASRNGYHAEQSSDLYVTDGDQIDWMYARHRIFSFTWELYPPETPTVWGDHYPADERIAAQTARNRTALLYIIGQADCPYRSARTSRINCGPFYDDFEIGRGWVRNPLGTDTSKSGWWERGNPAPTSSSGPKQLGTAYSGARTLVTGASAGTSASANDLDGRSSIGSPRVGLPATPGPLTFRYSFAHSAASTGVDYLRAYVQDMDTGVRTLVFEEKGNGRDDDGAWALRTVSLTRWAGRTIRILFVAQDGGTNNLVEAQVDDVRIQRPG